MRRFTSIVEHGWSNGLTCLANFVSNVTDWLDVNSCPAGFQSAGQLPIANRMIDSAAPVAFHHPVPPSGRLGLCLALHQGPASVLAAATAQDAHQAGGAGRWPSQHRLAQLPAHGERLGQGGGAGGAGAGGPSGYTRRDCRSHRLPGDGSFQFHLRRKTRRRRSAHHRLTTGPFRIRGDACTGNCDHYSRFS